MSVIDPTTCHECGRRMPLTSIVSTDVNGWVRMGLDGPSYLFCPACRERVRAAYELLSRTREVLP